MAAASDDGNWPFVPDPWKADPDMSQDMFAPSNATKEAAKRSFITAEVQQATGWLLLTHFGIILGSFGPTMSRSAFWLSWSIFILEAISKFVRSYIHNRCFRDVPCAYVPFHQQYVPFASGLYAELGVTLVEPCLYLPSWILFIEQWKTHRHCGSGGCPQDGVQRLDEFLLAACVITFCHFLSGVAATGSLIKAIVIPEEKLACLTWWVHLSRHGQLSAAAASGQPEVCGLPGHWFASVEKLREFLKANLASSALPHRHHGATTVGIQVMAIRGLLSLCKQGADVLETKASFDLILEALTEGSVECKGLAAAIIGVSATREVQRAEDFARAIRPLKQLLLGAHDKEAECRVYALGSLLNAALLRDQRVLEELLHCDELLNETPATFTEFLVEQAKAGPTCRCQVLAASLLAQLINMNKAPVRSTILTGQHERWFALLVERGPTLEVRAAAAGLLWELAYWSRTSQLPEISLRNCVTSLVKSLGQQEQEHAQLARNAAGALASFAYKNKVAKDLITGQANAIPNVVRMLGEDKDPDAQAQACRMLWILADNNAENQARIAKADAIPRLAKLLLLQKLDRQEVLVQAAWAISRLAFQCRDNQEAMASTELQIIPSLVKLLNFKGGESNKAEVVWEKAAQALGDIAKGNETNQEMIAKEEGAVEGLVALLRPEMQRQRVPIFAARAVRMLAEGNRGDAAVSLKRAASPRLQEILGLSLQPPLRSAVEEALHALDLET